MNYVTSNNVFNKKENYFSVPVFSFFIFYLFIYLFLNGNKEMFMIFVVTQYHLLVVIIVESGGNKN